MYKCQRLLICIGIIILLLPAMSAVKAMSLTESDPGFHTRHLLIDGVDRTYVVYVPKGYDHSMPAALVLMLHGAGGTAANTVEQTGWDKKADAENFFAVFGNATTFNPQRPANFLLNPQIWNDGSVRGFSGKRNIDDVGYVSALLDDMEKSFSVDTTREYVTGFSNGASMTFRVGVELATRIAAIAPVSGHLWLSPDLLARPVPMMFIIGTKDPLNPLEGGDVELPWGVKQYHPPVVNTIKLWTSLLGCPAGLSTVTTDNLKRGIQRITYSPCQNQTSVEFYEIEGMGHAWPGGKSFLPPRLIGSTSNAMNATDVIWEFFTQYRLNK